jgi:rhamnose transport system ATP-binding protein
LGIAAIYQQPALFPDLTVAENIALRLEAGGPWRLLHRLEAPPQGRGIARACRRGYFPRRSWSRPDHAAAAARRDRRRLGGIAKILILDEPTASLSDREVDNLFPRHRRTAQSQGVGMIYISHRLEELPQIADRVTVLRDGSAIGTKSMAEVDRPELIRLMVGRSLEAVFPKNNVPIGDVVLEPAIWVVGHRCTM